MASVALSTNYTPDCECLRAISSFNPIGLWSSCHPFPVHKSPCRRLGRGQRTSLFWHQAVWLPGVREKGLFQGGGGHPRWTLPRAGQKRTRSSRVLRCDRQMSQVSQKIPVGAGGRLRKEAGEQVRKDRTLFPEVFRGQRGAETGQGRRWTGGREGFLK